jgi:hypothetical protein
MGSSKSRLEREWETIRTMMNMYCKKFHKIKSESCEECMELFEYTKKRLEYCRFGENKPTCEKCPIHCYSPKMREKIRKVMRYAGPRMIYTHPIMGFQHLFKKFKKFQNSEL